MVGLDLRALIRSISRSFDERWSSCVLIIDFDRNLNRERKNMSEMCVELNPALSIYAIQTWLV
ncbi:hypothetical protein HYC85_003812 [Camellia sinensis]|uniref:Uncharacterized protein n=1 Tax=Camellia sinensis TaxID=4442 RepID=A0A7J7HVZ3_CAMSI|nr:hypothetical protein HYC85_003812 [Camellia sinensis]